MPARFIADRRVATLTLDEPETRNAITGPEILETIVSSIEGASEEIGVLIITGAGPAFSAGGNIKDMATRRGLFAGSPEEIMEGYRTSIQRLTRAILETDLATIAAVNGPAIGAGFDLALGCDLRLGSTSARFAHFRRPRNHPRRRWCLAPAKGGRLATSSRARVHGPHHRRCRSQGPGDPARGIRARPTDAEGDGARRFDRQQTGPLDPPRQTTPPPCPVDGSFWFSGVLGCTAGCLPPHRSPPPSRGCLPAPWVITIY